MAVRPRILNTNDLRAADIRWFGAVGDGVTDDTVAIQEALTVASTGEYSEIIVPEGTWRFTSPLAWASTTSAPVSIRGVGYASYLFADISGTDTSAIYATGASFAAATASEFRLGGTFSRGLSLVAASGSNVRVERCHVSGHTAFAGGVTLAAIRIGGLNDVWIVENVISGGGYANGDGSGQGYDILKNSGATQNRVHVLGNRVMSHRTVISVALFDCADSEVRGNYVDQGNTPGAMGPPVTMGYGITMYDVVDASTCRRNVVAENIVVNAAGMGVYLEQQYDSTVVGNVCRDTCKQITEPSLPLAGIVLNGAAGTVVGNVVKTTTGATHGIAFTAAGTTATGNFVSGTSAGVKLSGNAHRSTITGNAFTSTVHGVLVDGVDPDGLAITGNTFTSVSAPLSVQPGATLDDSTFSHNTMTAPQIGVYLAAGTNNTIACNHVDGSSSWGIQVGGRLNNVTGNVVRGATADGGILVSGDYCRVERNTATGNTGTDISVTGTSCLNEGNRTSNERASDDGAQGDLAPGPALIADGQWHIQYQELVLTGTQERIYEGDAEQIITDL